MPGEPPAAVCRDVRRAAQAARTGATESWYSAASVSTASPEAISPTTVATSMRVPAMQGLPAALMSESIEMPWKLSMVAALV